MTSKTPRVGFVSLGCPKALVDSERILTQLRAEGYEVAPTYDADDPVVLKVTVPHAYEEIVEAAARSEADAPEIDGVVRIQGRGAAKLPVGEFADVVVTGASEDDLEARLA